MPLPKSIVAGVVATVLETVGACGCQGDRTDIGGLLVVLPTVALLMTHIGEEKMAVRLAFVVNFSSLRLQVPVFVLCTL